MKFACLVKWRGDLNEVISGLNDYQQPPGYILPIVHITQITSSFPLPRKGISSHTSGKAIGVLRKTAAWNKLLPLEKSHWLHLCESMKSFWERLWLSPGSMNCQPVARHCYRGESVTADWHLTFATKMVNLTCKQHPSSCLWADREAASTMYRRAITGPPVPLEHPQSLSSAE